MVFGSTYCAISHLEIKDGDRCILIPLGFRMNFEFDRYNKADINCFAYLYTFIKPAVPVIFGGNVAQIKYAEDAKRNKKGQTYEEHELFMLLHEGFYNQILEKTGSNMISYLEDIPLFNTVWPIWTEGKEILQREISSKGHKYREKKITEEEYTARVPTPEWILNLYKVARFMGAMGIPPHPNWCHDQQQTGELYETMRLKALEGNI